MPVKKENGDHADNQDAQEHVGLRIGGLLRDQAEDLGTRGMAPW
jgi:hypothetical protein